MGEERDAAIARAAELTSRYGQFLELRDIPAGGDLTFVPPPGTHFEYAPLDPDSRQMELRIVPGPGEPPPMRDLKPRWIKPCSRCGSRSGKSPNAGRCHKHRKNVSEKSLANLKGYRLKIRRLGVRLARSGGGRCAAPASTVGVKRTA